MLRRMEYGFGMNRKLIPCNLCGSSQWEPFVIGTAGRCWRHAWEILSGDESQMYIWHWLYQNQQISNFLKHYRLDSRLVAYHDLTIRPDAVLANLMEWVGYEYEPQQKEYWTFSHHGSVKKNYLKMPEGGTFFDQRWKEDLEPSVQQKVFSHPAVCAYVSQAGLQYDYETGLTAFKGESFCGCQK